MTHCEALVLSPVELLAMQRTQYRHDKRNHSEIVDLHKGERLKHYGLHFCKYVGRLARGDEESISVERTLIDLALVSLSAANTLTQKLGDTVGNPAPLSSQVDALKPLADAAGRFADACEKFDHLEDLTSIARIANADIFAWVMDYAEQRNIDLLSGLTKRRAELAERAFYAQED